MATLIMLVRLPGSGKSTLFDQMIARGDSPQTTCDTTSCRSKDGSHVVEMSALFYTAIDALRAGQTCAIADIWFCRPGQVEHTIAVMQERVPGLAVAQCDGTMRANHRSPRTHGYCLDGCVVVTDIHINR